jgi:hypothetical protein
VGRISIDEDNIDLIFNDIAEIQIISATDDTYSIKRPI